MLVQNFGWRSGFNLIGGASLLTAIISFFFIKEPPRGQFLEEQPEQKTIKPEDKGPEKSLITSFKDALVDVVSTPLTKWATLGSAFRYFGQFANDYYLPLFYLTNFPTYKA